MSRPRSSWANVPTHFTREEANEWREWLHDEKGTDPAKGTGSRARPISFGMRPHKVKRREVDELYQRMLKRGIVAPE